MSELMTTTYSMWRLFRNCRMACKWRYIDELVPLERDPNLAFGSVIHDCLECWHGERDLAEVLAAREHWLIVDQLARLVPATVAEALKEYGAWSDEELADHDQNLTRLLWLACSDVAEEHVDA